MKYLSLFAKAFKSQFVYKNTVLFRLIGAGLQLFIAVNLWSALLSAGIRADTSLGDMILFTMVNMLVGELTSINIARSLEPEIRDGSVVNHLIKPMSFALYCISGELGRSAFRFLTTALPVVFVAALFLRIELQVSLLTIVFFILSLALGILIILELSYAVGLLAFFTQRAWYLDWYLNAGQTIFGGVIVPLWFFPQALNRISCFLPFRYISFEPINILLGKASFASTPAVLAIALIWVLLLAAIGHWMFSIVEKRLMINGG